MSLILKGTVLLVGIALLLVAISEVRDGQSHAQESPSLSASLSGSGVALTLSNHDSDDWLYEINDFGCFSVSGQTVNVAGYLSGAYTAKAYRNWDDCAGERNSLAQTTFGSGSVPSLSASVSDGVVTLTLSNYPHDWWYEIGWDGCKKVSSSASVEVRGYGNHSGETLYIGAYLASNCYGYVDETSLTLPATSLSASVTGTSVSLTVNKYAGDWWYKIDGGSCVKVSGSTASGITGYQAGTTHTAKAYRNSAGCGSDSSYHKLGQATFAMPSLSTSVSDGVVSITLSNYGSSWWYKIGDDGSCAQVSGRTASGITGYQIGAYSVSAYGSKADCDAGQNLIDSATFTISPPPIVLSTSVNNGFVTLTISNYDSSWWYKVESGSCSQVSGKTVSGISGYRTGTYSVSAYGSETDCDDDRNRLASATFTIPIVLPYLSASVSGGTVSMTLYHHYSDWWYKIGDDGSCNSTSGYTVSGIQGYAKPHDWTMTIKAYSNDVCFGVGLLDIAYLSMPATRLSASVSGDEKISLTLSNYPLDWWYRIGGGTCTEVSGSTVSGISGYRHQTGAYSVKAYRSSSDCNADNNRLAETSFTIAPQTLSASVSGSGVTLTLSRYDPDDWAYEIHDGGCYSVTGKKTVNVAGYLSGTYTAKAYRNFDDCSDERNILAQTTFGSGSVPSLSASVSDGVITLTLSDYPHDWWYEIDWDGCQKVTSGASAQVRGYGRQSGKTIRISAHLASDCYGYLGQTSLALPATSLSALVTGTSVTLTVNEYAGEWWYKIDGGDCVKVSGSTVHLERSYNPGTTYTAKAYSTSAGCASDSVYVKLGQTTFTPQANSQAQATSTPPQGQATSTPPQGQATSTPPQGQATSTPPQGQATSTPPQGQATSTPPQGQATSTPQSQSKSEPQGQGTSQGTSAPPSPRLSASVSDGVVSLTLSNYDSSWWYRIGNGICARSSGSTVSGISGYQPGSYSARAYRSQSGCYYNQGRLGSATFIIP